MRFNYAQMPERPGPHPQQSKRWLWVPLLLVVMIILCCIGTLFGIW